MLLLRIHLFPTKLDTLELLQASSSLATTLSLITNIALPGYQWGHLRMIALAPLILLPHHLFLFCRILLSRSGSTRFNSVDILSLHIYAIAYIIGTNVAVVKSLGGHRWHTSFINYIALIAVLVGAIVQCGLLVMLAMRTWRQADEQGAFSLSQDAPPYDAAPPSENDSFVSAKVAIASQCD
jgi:hypothetical protein